jgi:Alpha galactosidase A/Alpha galactosidase C-terminal beta sandwich domain
VPYSIMGAALNATGVPTFYSLCEPGQGPQTAPTGRATGNGWRVDEDDGGLWHPILDNVNMNAGLFPYSGCDEQHNMDGHGCGWNDMGLLMVGGGMTPDQDESHMALWCLMATKLLISVDPRGFKPHAFGLVSNPELIAIDQDALKLQGQRVDPVVNTTRSLEDFHRIRAWKQANLEGGSWKAAGRSHELLKAGGGAIPGTEAWDTLAAGGRTEIWQRFLTGGRVALLLFNNGIPQPTNITCAGACWDRMKLAGAVNVRDVIKRTDNGTATGSFSALVNTNGTVLVVLSS